MTNCVRKHRYVLRGRRLTVVFRYHRCRIRYTVDLSDWSAPASLRVDGEDWSARETASADDVRAAAKDLLYGHSRQLTAAWPLLA